MSCRNFWAVFDWKCENNGVQCFSFTFIKLWRTTSISATKRETVKETVKSHKCITDSHFLFDRKDSDVNEVSYEKIELFVYN